MATRINTRFVLILAGVLVVLTGVGVLAVMQLKKSAAEHVAIAEEALKEGDAALKEGDLETANARYNRAARNFYAADTKDGPATDNLRRFIETRNKVRVDNMTLAGNELTSIINDGAANIHDTPGTSDENRRFLYELLFDWHRMRPSLNMVSPIGQINRFANNRLSKAPDDPIALRYRAIGEAYLVESATDPDRRAEILEHITAPLEDSPEDVWLNISLARYHLGNARRQYRDAGNAFTDGVNASFQAAAAALNQATQLAGDDPVAMLEVAELTMMLATDDEDQFADLAGRRIAAAQKLSDLLQGQAARDTLYTEEYDRCISLFRRLGDGTEDHPFKGDQRARELAQGLANDRPDQPAAHAILADVYREDAELPQAEQQFEEGLAIDRLTNGLTFVRDQQARVEMLASLAEIKITRAQRETADTDARKALLDEAQQRVKQFAEAETPNTDNRDRQANLLRGLIELTRGNPAKAVDPLDKANQAYNQSNLQTLRALAQAHRQLGNTTRVRDLYEQIVQLSPRSSLRLTLANLYLSQRSEEALSRAQAHIETFLRLYPGNISAVRMMANLMAQRDDAAGAIALLQEQDTDAHPEVLQDIQRYQAAAGDPSGIIDGIRERIADRPEDEAMNLSMVTQLINLLPDNDQKLAELARLESQGLDGEIAAILREMITTGRMSLENEFKLLDRRDLEPAELAVRKAMLYIRRGQADPAREQLQQAEQLDPDHPLVIEWRYRLALIDQQWDAARQATEAMLELPVGDRPDLAVADGAFMRARVQAARAAAMQPGEERDKLLRDAASAYEQALSQYPFSFDGWLQLGKIQTLQGNFFAAQQSLREAMALKNDDVEVLEAMARAEVGSGNLAQAMDRYQQILQLQPNHPTAVDQFASLAERVGQKTDSIAIRQQIRERRPGDTDNRRSLALLYANNDQPAQAKAEIDAVIDAEGRTRTNIGVLSQVLLVSDQTEQAVQAVADYLSERGDEAGWRDYAVLAETHERADQPEQADAAFEQAVSRAEGDDALRASQAWGAAMLQRGQTQRAADLYQKLTREHPDNDQLKTRAAQLLIQNGSPQEGEALAKKLPESPERYQLLIQSALSQDSKNLDPAIQLTRDAVEAFPDSFALNLQLGRLLLSKEQRKQEAADRSYGEVHALARKLSEQYEQQVGAQLLLADVLIARDRQADASAVLENVLALAPTHVGASERLFNLRMNEANRLADSDPRASADRAAQALELITSLIESRPDLPQLYRNAGSAAGTAGRADLAAQYHGKAYEALGEDQDLANYAAALVNAGQGQDARQLLENPDHASLVSDNLYLRALRGRALAMVGESAKAASLFRNILDENKDNPQARAQLLRQAASAFVNDPDQLALIARETFGDTLPVDVDAVLSSLLIRAERYEDAAALLAKYERQPADDARQQLELLSRLALARQESGQYEKAKATYEQALAMIESDEKLTNSSQQLQLYNNLAYLLADQMQGYEQQAVTYARRAMGVMPDNASSENVAQIQDTLGWALYRAGQTDEAIRELQSSIDKAELSANQLHLGRVYLASGDVNKAVLTIQAALKRAQAQNDTEMIKQAQAWFDKAVATDPNP